MIIVRWKFLRHLWRHNHVITSKFYFIVHALQFICVFSRDVHVVLFASDIKSGYKNVKKMQNEQILFLVVKKELSVLLSARLTAWNWSGYVFMFQPNGVLECSHFFVIICELWHFLFLMFHLLLQCYFLFEYYRSKMLEKSVKMLFYWPVSWTQNCVSTCKTNNAVNVRCVQWCINVSCETGLEIFALLVDTQIAFPRPMTITPTSWRIWFVSRHVPHLAFSIVWFVHVWPNEVSQMVPPAVVLCWHFFGGKCDWANETSLCCLVCSILSLVVRWSLWYLFKMELLWYCEQFTLFCFADVLLHFNFGCYNSRYLLLFLFYSQLVLWKNVLSPHFVVSGKNVQFTKG